MAQSTYLLSVIIPFYNNERFINTCLYSLFSQIDDDVQVIIIDDGSTDKSCYLITQFLLSDTHRHVIFYRQKNEGAAAARNRGLNFAKGKFISFIDGDDVISKNYYSIIKPLLIADHIDLIDFDYQKFANSPPEVQSTEAAQLVAYDFSTEGLACLLPLFHRSMWHV